MTARDKLRERLSEHAEHRVEEVCDLFYEIESRGIHHWHIFDELVFSAISSSTEGQFENDLDAVRTMMIDLEDYFPEARPNYRPGYGAHLYQDSAFRSDNILKLFFYGTGISGGRLPERSVEHTAIERAIDAYLDSGVKSDGFERFAISISIFPRALGYALFLAQGERVVMTSDLSEIYWPSGHHFSEIIRGYESQPEFLNYLGRSWKARFLELGGSLTAAALAFITFGGIERFLTSSLAAVLSGLIALVIIGLPRILTFLASLWETRLEKKEALDLFNHLYQFCSITERTIRDTRRVSATSERDFLRIAIRRLKDLERRHLYFPVGLESLLLYRLKQLSEDGD